MGEFKGTGTQATAVPTSGTGSGTYAAPQVPAITLPKGGGAVRGIGETFTANPATGTGALTVPLITSPGRSGFGPQLSLSYDSGSGNGPFGFGWSLALPSITRKTDKGLPRYADAEESDNFLLSGAEDLVPEFRANVDGNWVLHDGAHEYVEEPRSVGGVAYRVRRYRPRVEGLFARIERWMRLDDGTSHWRSITRDNLLTLYGKDANSRIADPDDPRRIFSWLICETRDDKGNATVYSYRAEDGAGVDLGLAHERNRGERDARARTSNRYLKRIRYGNRVPLLDNAGERPPQLAEAALAGASWMFEVVFDYGDHDRDAPAPHDDTVTTGVGALRYPWELRQDRFSSYRAGFEVRTVRLCRRVMMFHHFPSDPAIGADCLVHATELTHSRTEDADNAAQPVYSLLQAVRQWGYKRQTGGGYSERALPRLEFSYSLPLVQPIVEEVDPANLEHLPAGLDGPGYQWTDLHGEGVPGLLSEQAGAWHYKRNYSPVPLRHPDGREELRARFGPLELVALRPSAELAAGAQLMDLAGDGQPDLVLLSGPVSGLYEHDGAEGWQPFRPFDSPLNRDLRDPNLRLVDLDGDGHADVLITEHEALVWHPSLSEAGFGPARRVAQAHDEERGPRLVFADGSQSIYLADLSGDGLIDLVRIRNGEVCYWPNLGYGHFGARVAMDNSPLFDRPEQFDQRRVRLADIDGTGTTDIVYLHRDGVHLYFNQSGNRWSTPQTLSVFPRIDDMVDIVAIDLLGNGTACLVWSSPLPGDARRQLRYVNLMGDQKPHLLVGLVNNLGVETSVRYAPSTRFYQADRLAGRPWITRLPFPVQVVERVETYDRVSRSRFVSRYAYHHGYFDGEEREFRGFGMVEQWDTEELGSVPADQDTSLPVDLDVASFIPPIYTRTWFHTGVYLGRGHVSNYFAGLDDPTHRGEYYREPGWGPAEAARHLLPNTPLPTGLSIAEEREACRALRGSMLRQEIYAQDRSARQEQPYTVVEQNFGVVRLQPLGPNRHAVFFTHPREVLTHHYERDEHDPRVQHALTLEVDAFGNVLRSLEVGYGRRAGHSPLEGEDRARQERPLLTYTETRYTVNDPATPEAWTDAHRMPLPAEVRTYELTGFAVPADAPRFAFDDFARDNFAALAGLTETPYQLLVPPAGRRRRLIECVRNLYRRDDLAALLDLGTLQPRALPGEAYRLAFTPDLLGDIFVRDGQQLLSNPAAVLAGGGPDRSGYVDLDGDGRWWMPSGRVFYGPDAAGELVFARAHFFLPHRYSDPFGQNTGVAYDEDQADPQRNNNLLLISIEDPLGNRVTATNDYRVLQPSVLTDPNGNRTAVAFDALGMVVGTAVMGKAAPAPQEGDSFDSFDADLSEQQIADYFDAADPRALAAGHLGTTTTRVIYDLERVPACTATIVRESHTSDPSSGATPALQLSFVYSDGFGRELQRKLQAEDGPVPQREDNGAIRVDDEGQTLMSPGDHGPRWVGSGWTIYNNKGKPVRQFEPFFSDTHQLDSDAHIGVSLWLFYDPAGRIVATLHPNRSWAKVVFDPWQEVTYDVNDTVLHANGSTDPALDPNVGDAFARLPTTEYRPTWYEQRIGLPAGNPERLAADQVAVHRQTPTTAHFDTLGRPFLTEVQNRFVRDGALVEAAYRTRVELDIEGNQRAMRDAVVQDGDTRGRLVIDYDYDMLGNRIRQRSMEAGTRWTLADVGGRAIWAWDSRGYTRRLTYDALRRPTGLFVAESGGERLAERTIYGEGQGTAANHRGRVYQIYDGAGIVTNEAYDFKGNLLRGRRDLLPSYAQAVDWSSNPAANDGSYSSSTSYDALNRPRAVTTPDNSVYLPSFNAAGLLERLELRLRGGPARPIVSDIDYDAKGQRELIAYANGAETRYSYDRRTFRLTGLRTTRPAVADPGAALLFRDPTVVQDLRYTYDPVGNLMRIADEALLPVFHGGQQIDPVCSYSYDAAYRLIEAAGREHIGQTGHDAAPANGNRRDFDFAGLAHLAAHPNDTQSLRVYGERYSYDNAGNLVAVRHSASGGSWTRRYSYDESSLLEPTKRSNRLSRTTVGNGGSRTESYSYLDAQGRDVNGCITAINAMTIEWDFKEQLQQVNLGGGGTAYYVYDANGQRVRKVIEGVGGARREERIYLGGFEIYRRYGNNALTRETLHVMDDRQRIALVETQTAPALADSLLRYQLSNHLGSASVELDANGALITYEEYHPFGTSAFQAGRSVAEVSLKRYRYTGKERDEETGLSYHGARYYAPWLGRWTSCDPAGVMDGTNLFVYVENRPIIANDPNGRWLNIVVGAVIGAAVGAGVELARQAIAGEEINWGRVGASAAGGAVGGAIAGATFGASLAVQAGGVAVGAAVGGTVTRTINDEPTTARALAVDTAVALATFGLLRGAGAAVSRLRGGGPGGVGSGAPGSTGSRSGGGRGTSGRGSGTRPERGSGPAKTPPGEGPAGPRPGATTVPIPQLTAGNPGQMLGQLPQHLSSIPPDQRARAIQGFLEQIRAANAGWTFARAPTQGGGTLFTGDLRGLVHIDAAGRVLYSGAAHGQNAKMLIALAQGNVDEALALGARVWANATQQAVTPAAVTGAGASAPTVSSPLIDALRGWNWTAPIGAGAGASSNASGSCPPGTAACVYGRVDLPGSSGPPVYNAETNSTTILQFTF